MEDMEKIQAMEMKLYDASLKGDVEMLDALMREDKLTLARTSVSSCFNQTPIHLACMLGHFDFTKALLCRKPDFASRLDSLGRSPLHLASANGYVKIVRLLLREDPDVCLVRDEDGRTSLHLAIMNGQSESVNELVKAKPEVTRYTMDHGKTIFHLCVIYNRFKVLMLLIESVSIDKDFSNVTDNNGSTILHIAASLKKIQIIKYLLKRSKVEINAVDGNCQTALDIIEQMSQDVKTVEIQGLLISAGALRAKESAATTPRVTGGADDQIKPQPATCKLLKKKKKKRFSFLRKKEEKMDESLLVAASVIAAMAYQAAISPPGGVIGVDISDVGTNHSSSSRSGIMSDRIEPGTSILGLYYWSLSNIFWMFNTISFMASLSLLLFASGAVVKRTIFIWCLRASMWITISSMTIAYVCAVAAISPLSYESNSAFTAIVTAQYTWLALILLSLLVLCSRFIIHIVKKAKNYINKKIKSSKNIASKVAVLESQDTWNV